MKKITLRVLVLLMILAVGMFIVACGDPSDNRPSTEEPTEILLNSLNCQIEKYDQFKINAVSTKEGTITFTSNDTSIAEVDATGLITGKKAGSTIIDVALGEDKVEFAVTVIDSGYVPFIELGLVEDEIGMRGGDWYQLVPVLKYNGTIYEDATFTYSKIAGDSVTVSSTGKIETQGIGKSTIAVSASWRGFNFDSMASTIDVNVFADAYIATSISSATIYTCQTKPEQNTEVAVSTTVFEEGQPIPSSEVTFELAQESATDVVEIEGNVIKGVNKGTASVVAVYTLRDSSFVVKSQPIKINVLVPELTFEQNEEMLFDFNKNQKTFTPDLIEKDGATLLELFDVTDGETLISNDGSLETAKRGKRTLRAEIRESRGVVGYVFNATLVTRVIYNAQDFMAIFDGIGTLEQDYAYAAGEYFILANNIDLTGKTTVALSEDSYRASVDGGFQGTLDGRGYVASNLTIKAYNSKNSDENGGIFGLIGRNGVVKNIAFENILAQAESNSYTYVLAKGVKGGTVENVFVSTSAVFNSTIGGIRGASTVKNLVVFTEKKFTNSSGAFAEVLDSAQLVLANNIYFGPAGSRAYGNTTNNIITDNIKAYASDGYENDVAYNALTFDSFDSTIWRTAPKSAPTFKQMVITADDVTLPISKRETVDLSEVVKATLFAIGSINGVTLNGSMLTVSENIAVDEFDAIYYMKPYNIPTEINVVVKNIVMAGEAYAVLPQLTDNFSYDLSDFNVSGNVYVDGTRVNSASVNNKVVSIPKTYLQTISSGKHEVVVGSNAVNGVQLNMIVATHLISTGADFLKLYEGISASPKYSYGAGKYFVLADNVDATGTILNVPSSNGEAFVDNISSLDYGFLGTLDGRGYKISNLTVHGFDDDHVYSNGIFGAIGSTGVVKNIAFENLKSPDVDSRYTVALAAAVMGTIENVFISTDYKFSSVINSLYTSSKIRSFVWVGTAITVEYGYEAANKYEFLATVRKATGFEEFVNVRNTHVFMNNVNKVELVNYNGVDYQASGIKEYNLANISSFENATYDLDENLWKITTSNVPIFKTTNLADSLADTSCFAMKGQTLDLAEACGDGTYEIETPVNGIKLNNGMLEVSENVSVQIVELIRRVKPFGATQKVIVTISVAPIETNEVFYYMLPDGDSSFTSDLSKHNIAGKVYLDGKEVEEVNYSLNQGIITFNRSFLEKRIGEHIVNVGDVGVQLKSFTIRVVSDKISNKEDFAKIFEGYTKDGNFTFGVNKYYVLTNDIDAKDLEYKIEGVQPNDMNNSAGFQGTLDGMGYTISNLYSQVFIHYNYGGTEEAHCGIFGSIGVKGVIRNIAFENVIPISSESGGTYTRAFANTLAGTLENVYFSSAAKYHTAFHGITSTAKIKNFVYVSTFDGRYHNAVSEENPKQQIFNFFRGVNSIENLFVYLKDPRGGVANADALAVAPFNEHLYDIDDKASYANVDTSAFTSEVVDTVSSKKIWTIDEDNIPRFA